jgi:outer membrane protein insertion porin family
MSNYFSSIYPYIEPVDEENVDIIFEVEEKITTNTDLSGGWSKQSGFTGGLGLQTNNFLGNGQSVGLHSNIGQNSKSFSFNYTEPWLLDKPVSAGIGLYYKDQNENYTGYSQKSLGGTLRIGHKLKWPDDYFHMDWIYKFDRTILNNFSNQIIETNPMGIINQSYPLTSSSLTHVISRNSLDRYDFPTAGSRISLSNEISGGILGGNADYHKHQLNADWYTSLAENLVLRTNLSSGLMNSYGKNSTIPFLQRFFLGGGDMSSSVPLRGYIDPLSSESINKNGGTTMMKGGLELRYRILKEPLIYALTFAEVGETWNKFNQVHFSNLRRSAGFGIRVDVPYLGLIGVDFAYGFDTFNPATGKREGQWQIHFIIGRLF